MLFFTNRFKTHPTYITDHNKHLYIMKVYKNCQCCAYYPTNASGGNWVYHLIPTNYYNKWTSTFNWYSI